MPKPERLTEHDLLAMIDNELRQSYGYGDGKLEEMRRRNEYYFLGIPKEDLAPPEIDGRSRVVDTTVRNTVLGMEAPLLKTFYGSDNVFEFEPTRPDGEPQAKLISEYVNHIFRNKNPGYTITATWIREALMQKVGIIKVWWDSSYIETTERYNGQTDVQLAILMEDEEIEVTSQKSYPDEEAVDQKNKALEQMKAQLDQIQAQYQQTQDQQLAQQGMQLEQQYEALQAQPDPVLYDVICKRTKEGGRVCIENVPPEEFLISRRAKSIKTSPFCAHRVQRSIGQLRSAGYTIPDNLPTEDSGAENSMERVERENYDNDESYFNEEGSYIDESQRLVWLIEAYMQVDFDGDGVAEWRKVCKSGTHIFTNEECDEPPFVALGSIPLPHLFFGMCPADLAIEPQRVNTSLIRAQLDNVYLQVNGRYFAVENQVNLDDLLRSTPGGIVRTKSPGAVGRLDQGIGDTNSAMQLMQWFEGFTEESTGWTRQSQGGNGLQLQQTATAANIITNRADSRVEAISRYMAETGFTDLGNMILKLVMNYQNKPEMIKVSGQWVNVDPREWTNQFSLHVNVGLGTGNKDQLVAHLLALSQAQAQGLAIGVANPENVYNANIKLANALGFKNGDEFFNDPKNNPPPQQQQDPALVKAQMDEQAHQREMAYKAQQAQADRENALQIKQIEAQVQMEVDRNRQQLEAEQQRLKAENELRIEVVREQNRQQMALEREQTAREQLALDRYKADLEAQTKIVTAQISAGQINDPSLAAAEDAANMGVNNELG
jgi:hypothetical protein